MAMPRITDNVREAVEGEYRRLPAGNYECTIVDATDVDAYVDAYGNERGEHVKLLVDISRGEWAGYFSDAYYDDHKRDGAHAVYLSYKSERALSMTKGRLHVISDCNVAFDAEAAWNSGNPRMLIGKNVGVQFNEEEWAGSDGEVKVSVRPGKLLRVAEIADGTAQPPRRKTVDGRWVALGTGADAPANAARAAKGPAPTTATAVADDEDGIPF